MTDRSPEGGDKMTPAYCDDLSDCFAKASTGGTLLRTLGERAVDFLSVEDFGCAGDGMTDDRLSLQNALNWSAQPGRAVYASRKYLLGRGLYAKVNTTLIATPSARFLRSQLFGTDAPDGGNYLLTTGTPDGSSEQANVWIEGGQWGFDYGTNGRTKWMGLTIGFAFQNGTPNRSLLTITAGGLQRSDFGPFIKAVEIAEPNGAVNAGQVFVFLPEAEQPTDQTKILVYGKVDDATVSGLTALVVPPAGGGMKLSSPGGTVRGVALFNTRGTGFFLGGDRFRLLDSSARGPLPDGGGGVRFDAGRGMRGTLLDIESSDDCFQFNPSDNGGDHETVAKSSFVDCLGRTNQGAVIAAGGGA